MPELDGIALLLDAALERLGEKDRNAIVLRFLRTKTCAKSARRWRNMRASQPARYVSINRWDYSTTTR
ncbi:MAG: hypothetical protein ABSF51_01605 [Verrucomicrobiota bacterium]|jgi:hypothetical protein